MRRSEWRRCQVICLLNLMLKVSTTEAAAATFATSDAVLMLLVNASAAFIYCVCASEEGLIASIS